MFVCLILTFFRKLMLQSKFDYKSFNSSKFKLWKVSSFDLRNSNRNISIFLLGHGITNRIYSFWVNIFDTFSISRRVVLCSFALWTLCMCLCTTQVKNFKKTKRKKNVWKTFMFVFPVYAETCCNQIKMSHECIQFILHLRDWNVCFFVDYCI